ncbi:SpoIID/LytB domain protein [Synechococcus sp. PCC 7502]|uniref:SpoIID/LytB domain-containing protein n=1 Tax=Synechococcus sp. PCC 7502 TaxID=1173263 RepID=UPI00029F94E8|nr:SpoIID/LytB domain-containing protein [Synechococcus sp. PCC 7502]AFY73658.1 SpoIID/LytB domain protein [Synechococcus sp. PCC 7502]
MSNSPTFLVSGLIWGITRQKWIGKVLVGCVWVIVLGGESLQAAPDTNPIMQMGIIQRFGENPQDQITLKAVQGDKLSLTFKSNDGKFQTIQTNEVSISIFQQPLSKPRLEEKVILSNHRSFENAAASAYRWRAMRIQTEIAQPRRWQVWAKRSIYDAFPLSSLLTYYLKLQGYNLVQLDRKVIKQEPLVSWVVGGNRYNRDSLDISSNLGVIAVNQRRYAGTLRLQKNAHQSYTLVNQVPLETYLRGVVPHEIGYKAPYPAIEAQVILARTYALASRHRFAVDDYQLCSTTQCQVYRGLEETSELADRAIADTKGQVLTFNNKVIDALYSSTTGGITANYNDLWDGRKRPYLTSVLDSVNPFDPNKLDLSSEDNFRAFIKQKAGFNEETWSAFRWRVESSMEEIKTTVREFLRLSGDMDTKFNEIKSLRIVQRSPSGRVLKIEVETDTKTILLEKDEIIDALYAPNSTFFYIEPLYEEPKSDQARRRKVEVTKTSQPSNNPIKGYAFIGGGLGHGVGMSQTGSYNLGKLGWSYEKILSFYFKGTKLQTLRPEFLWTPAELAAQ